MGGVSVFVVNGALNGGPHPRHARRCGDQHFFMSINKQFLTTHDAKGARLTFGSNDGGGAGGEDVKGVSLVALAEYCVVLVVDLSATEEGNE